MKSGVARSLEWRIGFIRLIGVAFAALEIANSSGMTSSDRIWAWSITAVFAVGTLAIFPAARAGRRWLSYVTTAFDFAIISAYVVLFAYQAHTPSRQLLYILGIEGAIRFGMWGGLATAVATIPIAVWAEERRSHLFDAPVRHNVLAFQAVAGVILAAIVGWLVGQIDSQRRDVEQRALEAEGLRDELGRRADLLEAANRCARALSSSLDLDEAFGAFIRELRGLVPFSRMAIVLAEEGVARVIATSGERADEVMPPGSIVSLENNLLADVVARGRTVVRADMSTPEYAEEEWLLSVGVHSRVAAPLLVGPRTIGLISLGRYEPNAFKEHEIELISLLGRLVASAVQNIRAYDSERRTVEELRRLSVLRADFVSLVSHEMRSPMAAVIGAARTLQQRWRELRSDQRESFLALIGDETTRLAALIGDVLDTSRIDSGTFSYTFRDVDVAQLVQDTVATASVGQDEVPIVAQLGTSTPVVRGDADRLRQVFGNLIDNAVKYAPAGTPVEVRVTPSNGLVHVAVSDRGPGVAAEDQRLIFEKFGRASGAGTMPGTGLGLFIARSIAEAHGGTLEIASAPGRGSTFTLTLPAL